MDWIRGRRGGKSGIDVVSPLFYQGVNISDAPEYQARSRGLLARVQIQTKIVLVVERGLKARGYAFALLIGPPSMLLPHIRKAVASRYE